MKVTEKSKEEIFKQLIEIATNFDSTKENFLVS